MHQNQYLNYPFLPYPYCLYYPHYEYQPISQCALNLPLNCAAPKIQHLQRPQLMPIKRRQSEQSIKKACIQSDCLQTYETGKQTGKDHDNSSKMKVKMQVNAHQSPKKDHEKEGRNANSNLLRMFFRKLELSLASKSSNVSQIIARHKLKITVTSFEEWFQINKAEHRKYIRLPMVRNLFSPTGKKNKDEHKIMRVLLMQFLRKQAHAHFLTSKKIKKANTKYQIQSCRNIISQLC